MLWTVAAGIDFFECSDVYTKSIIGYILKTIRFLCWIYNQLKTVRGSLLYAVSAEMASTVYNVINSSSGIASAASEITRPGFRNSFETV